MLPHIIDVDMLKSTNISGGRPIENRLFFTGFIIIMMLTLPGRAEDNDGVVFNRLYQEIMSSAPAELTGTLDSIRPATFNASSASSPIGDSPLPATSSKITPVPSTEQLKSKIEKMVQDANLRHSEAVKFMRDGK